MGRLNNLKRIIREILELERQLDVEERVDLSRNGRYTVSVKHPKRIGDFTVPDYYESKLEATLRDGVMTVVSLYVPDELQRRGIGSRLVRIAQKKAQELGFQFQASGVYSEKGLSLARKLGLESR
jgi:GNAT superfamily N-acetyltransferase